MAPLKGKKGYPAFLQRQKAKRRNDARAKLVAAARKLLKRELLALQRRVDTEASTNDRLERRLSYQQTVVNGERARCLDLYEKNKALKSELVQVRTKASADVASAEREQGSAERKLKVWEFWWQRVQERASARQLSSFSWLGRPRPRASDSCWGGGQ